jgi:hypothetical protein
VGLCVCYSYIYHYYHYYCHYYCEIFTIIEWQENVAAVLSECYSFWT